MAVTIQNPHHPSQLKPKATSMDKQHHLTRRISANATTTATRINEKSCLRYITIFSGVPSPRAKSLGQPWATRLPLRRMNRPAIDAIDIDLTHLIYLTIAWLLCEFRRQNEFRTLFASCRRVAGQPMLKASYTSEIDKLQCHQTC